MDDHIKMKDIPKQDRPYEKCVSKGPGILSDAELLAVILRTGSRTLSSLQLAQKVLELTYPKDDGLLGLCRLSLSDFQKLPGIGIVKAYQPPRGNCHKYHIHKPPVRGGILYGRDEALTAGALLCHVP